MAVSIAVKNACSTVGASPYWHVPSQTLLYVDTHAGYAHSYNPANGQDEKVQIGNDVLSLVIPTSQDDHLISSGRDLVRVDWETGDFMEAYGEVDEGTTNHFSEGKCDALGRMWAGTMGRMGERLKIPPEEASLYSLERNGRIRHHQAGITLSNGIGWSSDSLTMYHVDSIPGMIYTYDFDLLGGKISNRRTLIDFREHPGFPAGLCVDQKDKIWVACLRAGTVVQFDPITGYKLQTIQLPQKNVMSCCFGGKNLDELYVTCFGEKKNFSEERDELPLAGSLFRITELGARGGPVYDFNPPV